MPETYDKLVRDEIPEIIRDDGDEPVTRVVEGEAYRERLRDKLDEEVAEFHESGDVEELADVLAVVDALAEAYGSSAADLADIRRAKAAERGEFEAGIVLEAVRRSSGGECAVFGTATASRTDQLRTGSVQSVAVSARLTAGQCPNS